MDIKRYGVSPNLEKELLLSSLFGYKNFMR